MASVSVQTGTGHEAAATSVTNLRLPSPNCGLAFSEAKLR